MKYIKLLSALLLFSCNKQSVFEGFIPEYKETPIGLTVPFTNGNAGTKVLITEIIPGKNLSMYMAFVRQKATSTNGYDAGTLSVNDSLIIASVTPYVAPGYLVIGHTGYGVSKFSLGDELTYAAPASSGLILASAYKKPPYSASYISITHTNFENINFKIEDEAYISFQIESIEKKIYGWIKVKITPFFIYFESAGYKTFENIKAGKNE